MNLKNKEKETNKIGKQKSDKNSSTISTTFTTITSKMATNWFQGDYRATASEMAPGTPSINTGFFWKQAFQKQNNYCQFFLTACEIKA